MEGNPSDLTTKPGLWRPALLIVTVIADTATVAPDTMATLFITRLWLAPVPQEPSRREVVPSDS